MTWKLSPYAFGRTPERIAERRAMHARRVHYAANREQFRVDGQPVRGRPARSAGANKVLFPEVVSQ